MQHICVHITSIRHSVMQYVVLSVMQGIVCAGVACTDRQAESTSALSSIHWNACIKNGA